MDDERGSDGDGQVERGHQEVRSRPEQDGFHGQEVNPGIGFLQGHGKNRQGLREGGHRC